MIVDKIYIENNNITMSGYKNIMRPYKDWKKLYNTLLEVFPNNVYSVVEVTKKSELAADFEFEYHKDAVFKNENGFTDYMAKVLVDENVAEILYSALNHNNYVKVEKNKTLSLKYLE